MSYGSPLYTSIGFVRDGVLLPIGQVDPDDFLFDFLESGMQKNLEKVKECSGWASITDFLLNGHDLTIEHVPVFFQLLKKIPTLRPRRFQLEGTSPEVIQFFYQLLQPLYEQSGKPINIPSVPATAPLPSSPRVESSRVSAQAPSPRVESSRVPALNRSVGLASRRRIPFYNQVTRTLKAPKNGKQNIVLSGPMYVPGVGVLPFASQRNLPSIEKVRSMTAKKPWWKRGGSSKKRKTMRRR